MSKKLKIGLISLITILAVFGIGMLVKKVIFSNGHFLLPHQEKVISIPMNEVAREGVWFNVSTDNSHVSLRCYDDEAHEVKLKESPTHSINSKYVKIIVQNTSSQIVFSNIWPSVEHGDAIWDYNETFGWSEENPDGI